MELNNMTPDDNLKNKIYFEEDCDEIIHPDYRRMMNGGTEEGFAYGEDMSDEDYAECGAGVIVLLFSSLIIIGIIAFLFYEAYSN